MQDKLAFGRGIRMLRLARGLPQEAFSAVSSTTYVSVLERGVKSTSIEKACELASVLEVHPLTLFVAMFVERDERSIRDLLLRVVKDYEEVTRQFPENVGADPRNRDRERREVLEWLEACISGLVSRVANDVRPAMALNQELRALEQHFETAVARFEEAFGEMRFSDTDEPALPVARKREAKTYKNPYTGEVVVAKSRKDARLKAWSDQYGHEAVTSWVVGSK